MKPKVRVGLLGSQFISTIHAESLKQCSNAELVAVASPSSRHAADFAQNHGIPHAYTDYRELLAREDIDMVVIGIPNHLHCEAVVAAAKHGKHIVVENRCV